MASAGCHRLLREGIAVCVTDLGEVMELAGGMDEAAPEPDVLAGLLDDLGADERRVLDALPARQAAEVDNLVRVCGLGIRQTLSALGNLEMAGKVQQVGNGWRRAR